MSRSCGLVSRASQEGSPGLSGLCWVVGSLPGLWSMSGVQMEVPILGCVYLSLDTDPAVATHYYPASRAL